MAIQHFFAPDMRQAMILVKNALGSDAIIYTHRKVNGGIEIDAGLEFEQEPTAQQKNSEVDTVKAEPEQRFPIDAKPDLSETLLKNMQDELALLRSLLENQLAGLAWQDRERKNSVETLLLKRLREMDIDSDLCETIIQSVSTDTDLESAWLQVQKYLMSAIKVANQDLLTKGSIVALVGPTGVGKTTSIAKIAARYILRNGSSDVGLISTDSYRVAAREQLQVYGKILNVPVLSANSAEELQHAIYKLQDRNLILIDTAGVGHRDKELIQKLALINKTKHKVKTQIVISANSQSSCLAEAIKMFQFANLQGALLTKVDEASSLGPAISNIIKYDLPVAFISNGQRVPEDLQIAKPATILSYALSFLQKSEREISTTELAENFSGELVDAC